MRHSVRAVIFKDNQLLVMKRRKNGKDFYTLVGGGIDDGEAPEAALVRELREEASIEVAKPRLVIKLDQKGFGEQLIYACKYVSGEPALAGDSGEAGQTKKGQNTYQPMWLPIKELASVNLLPEQLKVVLWGSLGGIYWPDQPIELTVKS
ncbi:MAG TPA: NUDIX domain-containing protein [Candidatus Saccharimonadales bacterium]|nr:NUDIX domain-containing protein [Candidatus Saccharimonadales bacterium]